MNITIRKVDFNNPQDAQSLVSLLNGYAMSESGGRTELRNEVKQELTERLSKTSGAASFIASDGVQDIGLCNCFTGFSTFNARPLINIHDLYVLDQHQGKGVGRQLLQKVAQHASEIKACKVTLEVLSNNEPAIGLYGSEGFENYSLSEGFGNAIFMEKKL